MRDETEKKRRIMNVKKGLRLRRIMEMEGRLSKAICSVEIYDIEGGQIEVILCEPDDSKYKGISTTNHFEYFATKIKSEMLADTPNNQILWRDRLQHHCHAFTDYEKIVVMDFDGTQYSNPRWEQKFKI